MPETITVDIADHVARVTLNRPEVRIENRYTVGNEKRLYPVYEKDSLQLVAWRSEPVGIIYHTTESHQAPFDPEHNRRLRRVGRWREWPSTLSGQGDRGA